MNRNRLPTFIRNYKVKLAQEIIARFHDQAAAEKALENFEAQFKRANNSALIHST
jgi:tyrosyl-tRNA synthetase